MKPVSAKRLAEREARDVVRETTFRRAMFRCQAPGEFGIRCSGPLDCHERYTRGTTPGSHLDDTVTIALCRAHHTFVTNNPIAAHAAGLRAWSWEPRSPA
jgi:hypothetical protein